ncbi:Pregnancy zone protein C3 and PZP-like alpha-2-macroglobulin domain-containing protein 6 [Triplophysa tibetana]|uniref:Pregnancy zone protein C3 and PZP-like alpha-2-macroglobulin domain-containing protein 6 n=1 Tax=Triplophysa tibetana TaxID=1572043 RepID=A0A5A9MYJ4_9TELE|nr:Pregnancy zone protein C3 and PZP-like alpha-2-macroglobulin domain-containing protein 6 [Triplophysa tibetana]
MAPHAGCFWKGLLLFCLLSISVNGDISGPFFMVTFPAVIQSGSEAKLCASLLKPNESLIMNIYVVNGLENTLLLKEEIDKEFHRCFDFQAPLVVVDSVQEIKVEVKGESFQMTEERKVMFRHYNPLTFIQTDKPIYIPGQTVRVVTMDTNFAPLDQQYSAVVLEDGHGNRIGQWSNVSSTRWILQRSYDLNPEARLGRYKLTAQVGERMITQDFKVEKYVLPKFDVTVKKPTKVSIGEEEMTIEVCGKYTYGQPVPGTSWVKVCRNCRYCAITPPCLEEITEMKENGCATHTISTLHFLNTTLKDVLENSFTVDVKVTEEGTESSMTKSESISLTYEIGKVTVTGPKTFEHGSVIEGHIKLIDFKGMPIPHKDVYLFEGDSWSSSLLLNLTTDSDGLAAFSLNTSSLAQRDISLMGNIYPDTHYRGHTNPHYSTDKAIILLFRPATPYTPTLSELTIEGANDPLKCNSEFPVTIKYYFIGETTDDFKTDIVYMVLSRGVIVHHGYENVKVKTSNGAANGSVSFKLSVEADLSPAVQILAYCLLPSDNVVAGSRYFEIEKCFNNKVSVQFSPASAVPGEENTVQLSAQAGSLCALSAIDQSVMILESGKRLDVDKIFELLPVRSAIEFPYNIEDQQECLHVRPRRASATGVAYETLKKVGLKMATNLPIQVPRCLQYKGLTYQLWKS